MSREDANGFVLEFLSRYEHKLADPDRGRPFDELYDTDLIEPTDEWLDIYGGVSEEITALGLDMDRGWRTALQGSHQ